MDNFDLPPGTEEPGDTQPTQQFWPVSGEAGDHTGAGGAGFHTPGAPGSGGPGLHAPGPFGDPGGPGVPGGPGAGGPGQHWRQPPGPGAHPAKDRHRARRWAAGVVAAAVLAAGGVAVGVLMSSHSPAAGPTGQAAALDAVLSSANSAPASPGSSAPKSPAGAGTHACARAARAARAAGRRPRARIAAVGCRRRILARALLHGLHGQFTFTTKKGTRTLAFERGTVSSVTAGHDIVVRASDGTTWTWALVTRTVVRSHGSKVTTGALSAGETVWVGGPVTAGTRDARLIVIAPARAASPSPSTSAG